VLLALGVEPAEPGPAALRQRIEKGLDHFGRIGLEAGVTVES
jgi:hypothetical protein